MAMKVTITIGGNSITIDGEYRLDGLLDIIAAWTRALGPDPGQEKVDALVGRLHQSTTNLETSSVDQTTQGA